VSAARYTNAYYRATGFVGEKKVCVKRCKDFPLKTGEKASYNWEIVPSRGTA
jgi:hypothetical protein